MRIEIKPIYNILPRYITVIFCLQYIALLMYIVNSGGLIQRVYTILLTFIFILAIAENGVKINSKIILTQMAAVSYMILNALIGVINGNKLHIGITNCFPVILMLMTEIIVYSTKDKIIDVLIIKCLSYLSLIASIAIIIATFINIKNRGIQEGYRFLSMQITCIGPLMVYYYFFVNKNQFMFLSGAISIIAIICTYSKQMYLSMFVLLVLILLFGDKKLAKRIRNSLIIFLLLIMAISYLRYASTRGGFLGTLADAFYYNIEILTSSKKMISQETPRLTEMKYAIERLKESWVFGIGSGATYTSYGLKNWVHNGWLWMLLNFGVLGTTLFLVPIVGIFVKMHALFKNTCDKEYRFLLFYYFRTFFYI